MHHVDQLSGFLRHLFIFKIVDVAAEIFFTPQIRCFGFLKSSVHFWQLGRGALVGLTRTSIPELNPTSAPRSRLASIANFQIPQKGLTRAARAGELTPWRAGRSSRPPTASAVLNRSRSSSLQHLAAWGDVWVARREVPRSGGELGRS